MRLRDQRPVLVCIDIQQGFQDTPYWGGGRNNPNAEARCIDMLHKWRAEALDIIHVRHASTNPTSPLHPSKDGFAFYPGAEPMAGEGLVTKSVNSGFIGTDLKKWLDEKKATHLVIIGLTTDHCVSTTTRMAGNFGYQTYLVSDAVATFDKFGVDGTHYPAELIHQTALASLKDEFATILTSEDMFKLM